LTHGHVFTLQSRDKFDPVRSGLFQAVGPKFQEHFCIGVVGQDTIGALQSMKLIPLNIHFDQVNALAGLEVIIERYDIDLKSRAQISLGGVCPVIDI
jgi:hypothetical protein